jgi:hypothetical protein
VRYFALCQQVVSPLVVGGGGGGGGGSAFLKNGLTAIV